MKRGKSLLLIHAAVLAAIAIYYALAFALGITCPIRALIGYPCPACGMSRAMVSLLLLDFKGYVYYNAMALPIILGILTAIHVRKRLKRKWPLDAFLIIAALANLAYYAARLLTDTAP